MADKTSFHAEKCRHLVSEHEASTGACAAAFCHRHVPNETIDQKYAFMILRRAAALQNTKYSTVV